VDAVFTRNPLSSYKGPLTLTWAGPLPQHVSVSTFVDLFLLMSFKCFRKQVYKLHHFHFTDRLPRRIRTSLAVVSRTLRRRGVWMYKVHDNFAQMLRRRHRQMPARSFVRSLQAWHSERTGHPQPSVTPVATPVRSIREREKITGEIGG
jgi:hypothetical protein